MNTTTTVAEINQISYFVNGAMLRPLFTRVDATVREAILDMALTNLLQIGICSDSFVEARRQQEIKLVREKIASTKRLAELCPQKP